MVANYQAKSGLLKQSGGEGFWRHSLVNYPVHYFMRFHDKVINLWRQIIEWPMSLKMQILRAVNEKTQNARCIYGKSQYFCWRHKHISRNNFYVVSHRKLSWSYRRWIPPTVPLLDVRLTRSLTCCWPKVYNRFPLRAKLFLFSSSSPTFSPFLSLQFWTHWWWSLWRWNPVWESTNQMFYWRC